MRDRRPSWPSRSKKLVLIVWAAALAGLGTPIVVGILNVPAIRAQDASDWQTKAGGKMVFEVASVKPAKAPTWPKFPLDNGDAKTPGGRFSETAPLLPFIVFAYKLSPSNPGIAQLPEWARTDQFEIEALGAGNPTKDQMRLMTQALLADRFKLAVHFESRQGSVLALVLVKPGQTGPRLRPHADGPACPDTFEMPAPPAFPPPSTPPGPPKAGEVFPPVCGASQMRQTGGGTLIGARNTTMELIASDMYSYGSMGGEVDKPVVNQTGLQGNFDFTLELHYGLFSFPLGPPKPADAGGEPQGPRFLNAVRDQLGLKLVPAKGAIRKLVIDHIERPSEN